MTDNIRVLCKKKIYIRIYIHIFQTDSKRIVPIPLVDVTPTVTVGGEEDLLLYTSVYSTHSLKSGHHLSPGTIVQRGRPRRGVKAIVEVYGSSSSDCFNFLSEERGKQDDGSVGSLKEKVSII